MSEKPQNLEQRMQFLAERFGQAEIARRTGTSRQNVHRYLQGTRAPVDFASALATELGVNPAWLLTGQGTPFLADISAGTEQTAGDLLAVVKAMETVARMRLGQLVGKDYLKVLRELDDTLRDYEALRGRIDHQTAPLLGEMLSDLEKSLRPGRLSHARSVRDAARQITRLCAEPGLLRRLDLLDSILEYESGNIPRAAELGRVAFLRGLMDGERTSDWAESATLLIVTLHRAGRAREARRISRAVIDLLGDGKGSNEEYWRYASLTGHLCVELGDLHEGLALLTRAAPHVGPEDAVNNQANQVYANLMAGSRTPMQLSDNELENFPLLVSALAFARWTEDARAIRTLFVVLKSAPDERKDALRHLVAHMQLLVDCIDGRNPGPLAAPGDKPASKNPAAAFCDATERCQAARLAGDERLARRWLLEAQSHLDALPPDTTTSLLHRGTHYRSVLALIQPGTRSADQRELRERASVFFEDYFGRGYGCFRAQVEALSGSRIAG